MKQSKLFPKTIKNAPKDAVSANHKYLVRAGFIDQLMAGSWTILPLGWKVIDKIIKIIREEMNAIGAQEMLMPLMHPKDIWNETGRWDSASEVMYQLKDSRDKEFALSFTHEEIVMDLLRKHINSYTDLPVAIYHFSTKFRNEPRPTGGILRGREFLMKDLYSAHATEEDLKEFYEMVSDAYMKVFERIGFETYITEAAGGVFTENRTREFQVVADAGEDTIYIQKGTKKAINKEVFDKNLMDYEEKRAIEVGNIFPFGNKKYAEKMNVGFTDKDGQKKLVYFASYGIGVTRLLGTIAEVFHDDSGLIWPKVVTPFDVHLLQIGGKDNGEVEKKAENLYKKLTDDGIEVLWDDRDISAGEKFADCDLIGIPVRVVVSEKTEDKFEFKKREDKDSSILSYDELLTKLKS
ncbi:MAG TPA: aminoacyl--tRNA ligase-related protein [Patescibacteria group bacterium]|nr:aminoacyl--tRNA ligase-related protein [Patescibacteria group bacterium]